VLGGAERVLVYMLKALQNNELSLLADRWDTEAIKKTYGTEISNVNWVKCHIFHPFTQHFVAFQWLRHTQKINNLIREICGEYDLLVETQQVYVDPCSGMPLISYIHYPDMAAPPPEGGFSSSIYYALLRTLVSRRIKKVNLALTNSPFTAKIITKYLKIEPVVLYPPVDVERFHSDKDWSDREDKVVTIGTFLPFKRQHILLEVARKLPETQFVIIGNISEDYRDYYEKLILQHPNNVKIIPNASSDQIKEQLSTAKAYVHLCPEHFGISVIEAAAAGCVPIVYYLGGPAESLGEASLKWKDTQQLVSLINETINDRSIWSKLNQRAKQKSEEFDTSTFETRMKEIINKQLWKQK
jgi:glycosyltransferase involved in cell wall biosynthesis